MPNTPRDNQRNQQQPENERGVQAQGREANRTDQQRKPNQSNRTDERSR